MRPRLERYDHPSHFLNRRVSRDVTLRVPGRTQRNSPILEAPLVPERCGRPKRYGSTR
jgi:hypothetical protein